MYGSTVVASDQLKKERKGKLQTKEKERFKKKEEKRIVARMQMSIIFLTFNRTQGSS